MDLFRIRLSDKIDVIQRTMGLPICVSEKRMFQIFRDPLERQPDFFTSQLNQKYELKVLPTIEMIFKSFESREQMFACLGSMAGSAATHSSVPQSCLFTPNGIRGKTIQEHDVMAVMASTAVTRTGS